MKKMWAEFKDFLNQGDFVTIAVGLIIALQVKDVVDAIIAGIINPILSAIVGKQTSTDFGFDIGDARISIGLVISRRSSPSSSCSPSLFLAAQGPRTP